MPDRLQISNQLAQIDIVGPSPDRNRITVTLILFRHVLRYRRSLLILSVGCLFFVLPLELLYRQLIGDRYRTRVEKEKVQVWSNNDERGKIFQLDNHDHSQRFKNALIKFTDSDFNWFVNAKTQILANRHEAQQQQPSQRDLGGFQLEP